MLVYCHYSIAHMIIIVIKLQVKIVDELIVIMRHSVGTCAEDQTGEMSPQPAILKWAVSWLAGWHSVGTQALAQV